MTEKKRYFSEEEIKSIAYEYTDDFDILGEESLGARRWSETIVVDVYSKKDDKYYSITWERGLTEMQEDDFYAQEFPEVFPYQDLQVKTKTLYLTEDVLQKKKESTVSEDLESLRLVSDAEKVDQVFSTENLETMKQTLELLENLSALDSVSNFSDHRKAAIQYFQTLLDHGEENR